MCAAEPVYLFTHLAGPTITDLAGNVDGVGAAARFETPGGLATDNAGNVYVADPGNHTIRKITPTGAVTTLAGKPGGGTGWVHSADGLGAAALFVRPVAVAWDEPGGLYVVEESNFQLRRVTTAGMVSTIAGTWTQIGSKDGPAVSALFFAPTGVATDKTGNVYIADTFNHTIRKLSAGMMTTLAGTGGLSGSADGVGAAARFKQPRGVAVGGAGTVYVADQGNHTIRKIMADGTVMTLAGTAGSPGTADGIGSAAAFSSPRYLALESSGNLLVTDFSNTIRRVTPSGVVTTIAGIAGQAGMTDGPVATATFSGPAGIATDSAGTIYISDVVTNLIRKISPAGMVTTFAGGGQAGAVDAAGSAARFHYPRRIAVGGDGSVYVADNYNHAIRKITPAGVVTTFAGKTGRRGYADGAAAEARFAFPWGVAVDGSGNVYVADGGNLAVRKVTPDGVVSTLAGGGESGTADGVGAAAHFRQLRGIAVDSGANVYVTDATTIRKITPAGGVTTWVGDPSQIGSADGVGSAAHFIGAVGLAVGKDGTVYVADEYNHAIRKVTASGQVTTLAGGQAGSRDGLGAEAQFTAPQGMAIDGNGNLLVADYEDGTLRRVTPAGRVTTVAGATGQIGSADGVGAEARFYEPWDVALDAAGNLYVADGHNHAIRKGVLQTPPVIVEQPRSAAVVKGGGVVLGVGASGTSSLSYHWQRNGSILPGATGDTLTLNNVQPADTGLYTAAAVGLAATTVSDAAIVGLTVPAGTKVVGAGREIGTDIHHQNGNVFDQVLLEGAAEALTADYDPDPAKSQVTRTSFIDLDDDIVQVEFSGPGTLSLVLDGGTGPAAPVNYNQTTTYMKGHLGIVITGATERTNLSVFSVGRQTAVNQALFKDTVTYDGIADIAFIAIASANGKFGGVRTANVHYFAAAGLTGVYAPGVAFQGPVFIGNITAFDGAVPVIQLGSVGDARITGGDLAQANGAAVQVSGLTQLKFTPGGDSHGNVLAAKANQAVLLQNGAEVTAQIVVNPGP